LFNVIEPGKNAGLLLFVLVIADFACGGTPLQGHQLPAQSHRVVELTVSFLVNLLEHPQQPARPERDRAEKRSEHAHSRDS
jgi:hypothetical protein